MLKILFFWGIFFLFMLFQEKGMAQEIKVFGVVMDEDHFPLPGATVKVKNSSIGTVTDHKGYFRLSGIATGEKLLVSYVGKRTVEVAGGADMKIMLLRYAQKLDEVMVQVAYGSQKSYAVAGAVSTMGSKEIGRRPVSSVVSALDAGIPGLLVNATYGQPGEDPDIRIRGFASVNGVNTPLYVVDGVPYSGSLADLNPDDVESVSVLKDALAAVLYGNRAANGVILITLKQAKSRRLSMEFTVRQGVYARGIKEYARVGTDDFMEVMWKSYRNSLLTNNPDAFPTLEEANRAVNET